MQTEYIDLIVNEILTDMSHRRKGSAVHADPSPVPDFEDAFGELIQEDDQTSRDVMHRIWKELRQAQGVSRVG
jgi:hypothetical protein